MPKIYPLALGIPPAGLASTLASPPYDVLSVAEAREIAERFPGSYVRVIRPEIDLPAVDPSSELVYQAARRRLDELYDQERLVEHSPAIYLYQQRFGPRTQTGIVCGYDVDEYRQGKIKKHELTRPDKENDRVRHMLACAAHPEPVLLTFRSNESVDDLMRKDLKSDPIFDFIADDGVSHRGWKVADPAAYVQAMARIDAAYIADGHHRTAAADRVATELAGDSEDGSAACHQVLSVMFPVSQLSIMAYNRVVNDSQGRSPELILRELEQCGTLTSFPSEQSPPGVPQRRGEVGCYINGAWRSLQFAACEPSSTKASLDVSRLQEEVLKPVFGIDDPRTDPQIGFVGGIRGTSVLADIVDRGEASVAFSMFPTSMEDLLAISDEGEVMPPKSTWFEPKLRSGLFVHRF